MTALMARKASKIAILSYLYELPIKFLQQALGSDDYATL